ncbi:MAG: hypothetical protein IPP61_05005 [Cytophagaceae bacterium]|nr:hypothetical protein [Cytophagaceae bacterium]MBK9935260.1 hypothetical protein [Cytophagaceae bacterium]MBL0301704.1 hypothetical protein [Cytophagaceae bacterium]MBL0324527.1 hypothetical protein [Cytophagaceae bacterium]
MLEFNFEPFAEFHDASKSVEYQNSPAAYSATRPSFEPMNRNVHLSPNYNYSGYYPLNSLGSPLQSHYDRPEPKEKSYWWLWLFPIAGVLIFIYYYKKEEIDAYLKRTFKPFFPTEIKEELVLE